jgi:hypothetical protein
MKWCALGFFVLGMTLCTQGQLIFRNDFVLGPHHKVKNKGLSFITINLDRYPNLNMLVNGRGGQSIVIDLEAIRNPGKTYTYSEIAEKIYTPGPVFRPSVNPVPMFLLLQPPAPIRVPVYKMDRTNIYR